MADIEKTIKGLEALYDSMHENQCYACSHEFVEVTEEFGTNIVADAIELLKEQDETIKELQSAYGYLQKQFFEAQDKLLKEQEGR